MTDPSPPRAVEFSLSFNRFMRLFMTLLLTGPRWCRVLVEPDRLEVTMGPGGWAFAASVPRSPITNVERTSGPVWSWGAHGWRGRWLVNGSSRGLVRMTVDPPGRGRCLGFPITITELCLSLEDPEGFIAALAA